MNITTLRMVLAALKQALRDRSEEMTEEEINEILDRISILQKIIEELEGS